MKMALVRLTILISKVHVMVYVMIMVLIPMKYGRMGIGFIQYLILILVMVERLHKGYHKIALHGGQLPNLKVEILEKDADLCGHISI